MPRYYFDLRDSSGLWADEEGIELRNLSAAQDEAAVVGRHGAGRGATYQC